MRDAWQVLVTVTMLGDGSERSRNRMPGSWELMDAPGLGRDRTRLGGGRPVAPVAEVPYQQQLASQLGLEMQVKPAPMTAQRLLARLREIVLQ